MAPSPYQAPSQPSAASNVLHVWIPRGISFRKWLRLLNTRPRLVTQAPGQLVLTDVRIPAHGARVIGISAAIFAAFVAIRVVLEMQGVGVQVGDTQVGPVAPGFVLVYFVVQQLTAKRLEIAINNDTLVAGVVDLQRRLLSFTLQSMDGKTIALYAPKNVDWDALTASLPSKVQPGLVKAANPMVRLAWVLGGLFVLFGAIAAVAVLASR